MCLKLKQFVQNFDVLSKPVQMSYNQETNFTTAIGGTVSLTIMLIILLGYTFPTIYFLFANPTFDLS